MTRAVYVVGGAGVGKSTYSARVLEGYTFGPLEDLHSKRNAKALVTLRGHRIEKGGVRGLYLGVKRDSFPGSDGLDRASSPTGKEWMEKGDLPDAIFAEGATLATRPFLYALAEATDLYVQALRCDPMVHDLRLYGRGSGQSPTFVASTVTKTENLVRDLLGAQVRVDWVDTDDEESLAWGLRQATKHLERT